MFNPIPTTMLRTYFENPVGRLLEHPVGDYIVVEYGTGPRQLSELQAFLTEAGQLLAQRGWDKLRSHKGMMPAFTQEETKWVTDYWFTGMQRRPDMLYGAMLLPHEVFASLSWKGSNSSTKL